MTKMKVLFTDGSVSRDITDLDFKSNLYTCGVARRSVGYHYFKDGEVLIIKTNKKQGTVFIWINTENGDKGIIKNDKFEVINNS